VTIVSMEERRQILTELREHYFEHQRQAGAAAQKEGVCGWCDLWRGYMSNVRELDRLMRLHGLEPPPKQPATITEALWQRFDAVRSEWGEGGWTARDVDEQEHDE
jgi:hypothetical protein